MPCPNNRGLLWYPIGVHQVSLQGPARQQILRTPPTNKPRAFRVSDGWTPVNDTPDFATALGPVEPPMEALEFLWALTSPIEIPAPKGATIISKFRSLTF